MTDKILLVDDDPMVLEGLKAALHGGSNLRTATGPETGLETLRSTGPYAVVVSDLKMPGMNGIEFHSWKPTAKTSAESSIWPAREASSTPT